MSLVTNTSQSSAITAVRLAKPQTLHQVLTQGKSDEAISQALAGLKKIDRKRIREEVNGEEFGPNKVKQKTTLISVVKGGVGTLSQSKIDRVFQTSVGKSGITANPFFRVPNSVQTTVISSFLAPKDLANFRASFKVGVKIESASYSIKTHQLNDLIETYLHQSCSGLNENGKTKALHELISLAYSLSEIEEFPEPSYASLLAFFQEVEARNLIRMMGEIHRQRALPGLPEDARDLQVPKDPIETMQKAKRLREWIDQHQDFLAAINGALNFEKCRLSLVPKEIGQLQALEILRLGDNGLVCVPKEIGQLQALKSLYLYNNRLVRVPIEIGKLQALQVLWLNNNRLVGVPKEIGQLQALQVVWLNNNRLVGVPKEIGQLQALKWLRSEDNRLVSVPKEIGQLQALEMLRLDSNRLVSMPKEIGQLQKLESLDLDNNRLVSVPKEVGQLQALQRLYLANNRLISLPPKLDRFKDALEKQNKQLQLKTILGRLSLCVAGLHNTKKIAGLLDTMEKLLGKETLNQIHRCLYKVAQRAAKADKTLHEKLKDKHFARKAFLDENISPKLKAAAIASFRKNLEKQPSA